MTSQNSERPLLQEGDIILPYRGDFPIMLFDNEAQADTFIRARKHQTLNVWYSEVDESAENDVARPRSTAHYKSQGAIVFLSVQQLQRGQGIRITRAFKGGLSARGVAIDLPANVEYPYQADTSKLLFKPLK